MKIMFNKIMFPLLLTVCMTTSVFAQMGDNPTSSTAETNTEMMTDKVDNEDYERLLDAYLRVSFREYAYEALDLNSDQIIALDPLYMAYMKERNELMDKRTALMEDYVAEMKEDDRAKDEAEESAEYIEDYWEINIDEQRLRKETFDRMEDAISYRKAFEFFLLEEAIANRVNQEATIEYIPVLVELDRPAFTYYREMDRYNVWMKQNRVEIDGTTSLDHHYTHDGLMKLTRAIESTVNAVDGEINNFDTHIATIKEKANEMTQEKYANTHADAAHVAFTTIATLMEEVAELDGVVIADENLKSLRMAAEKIDPDTLYLEQSKHAYNFFTAAQVTLNNLYTKEMKKATEMTEYGSSSDRK
jgi:hypothetical protein